jgi:hypothetical protein
MAKVDSEGYSIWDRTYGGPKTEAASAVQQTSDGGFLALGWTESFGAGKTDLWLVRTNGRGETLWTKTYGDTNYNEGYDLEKTEDGGFIILGISNHNKVWLLRLNSSVDSIWSKFNGISNGTQIYAIKQTSDGGYIMTGHFDTVNNGGRQGLLIHTDSSGSVLWQKKYGSPAIRDAIDVIQSFDGGFSVTGTWPDKAGKGRAWLLHTNAAGDSLWTQLFGIGGGNSIIQLPDSGYMITGTIYDTTRHMSAARISILRLNKRGDTVWTKTIGDSTGIYYYGGISIRQINDSSFIIAGLMGSSTGEDAVLIKVVEKSGQTANKNPENTITGDDNLWIDPNPFNPNSNIYFKIPKRCFVTIGIFDVKGHAVKYLAQTVFNAGTHFLSWKAENIPSGLYLVKFTAGGKTAIKRALLVK